MDMTREIVLEIVNIYSSAPGSSKEPALYISIPRSYQTRRILFLYLNVMLMLDATSILYRL